MRNYTTIALVIYSIVATAWLSVCFYENKLQQETQEIRVKKFEKIILMQEKLMMEMDNLPAIECEENHFEDDDYTYDQWISNKPCPKGRHGPLCHMDTPEA
jgi:hypothetical protein